VITTTRNTIQDQHKVGEQIGQAHTAEAMAEHGKRSGWRSSEKNHCAEDAKVQQPVWIISNHSNKVALITRQTCNLCVFPATTPRLGMRLGGAKNENL